jgi:trans-aconitate methyltransferase
MVYKPTAGGPRLASNDTRWTTAEAIRYEEFAEKSFSWRCIEEPSLRSLIEPCISETTVALDLGCGGGRIIRLLEQLGLPEDAIFGIDGDQALIQIARQKYPQARLVRQDITHTPYDAIPKVDLATAHFILQYLSVDDLLQCLAELHRLLIPRGYLAVGLPHPARVAQQAGVSYFSRTSHRIPAPWGGLTVSSGLTVSGYLNCVIDAGFALRRIAEPDICKCCQGESGEQEYVVGPTRLMILAQAQPMSLAALVRLSAVIWSHAARM